MKIDRVALGHATDVSMPEIGIGTWHMGEDPRAATAEIAALRHAREIGFTHFDTAEMYADGGAETILGRAFAGQARDGVFLTSKVYPWNAAAPDMIAACERSIE
uniref:aldo/keto reductase n=1 Tax=Aquicoccus sp. TaxID=2055851 RepID=UPI0035676B82